LALLPFLANGAGGALPAAPVWKQLGPFGGPAEFVVTSPSTPNLLLAGSPNAMLYRSLDAGASWTHLPFPGELASTLHVILPHPTSAGRMLVGVSPDSGGSGLFLSVDSGQTWSAVAAFSGKDVWALAHFPADPRMIVAGAADGVYQSEDAGETWRRMSPEQNVGLKPVVAVAIHPTKRDIVYAGTPHLPWKTVNGGRTWQSAHTGMLDDSDVFSIEVDRRNPTRVLASACSGIYRSITSGATWTKLRGSADSSFRTYVIVHDPHVAGRVWAGTTHGLMRSADGGATWRTAAKHSVKSIAFDVSRAGTLYLATRDAGLLKTTDAATFVPVNRGFVNRGFFALAGYNESLWLSGEGIGMLESPDGGHDWKKGAARDRVLMMSTCRENGAVFVGGANFLRQFLGNTWTTISEPRREPVRSVACLGPLLFAVSSRGAYHSPDGGKTWAELPSPDASIEWNQLAASTGGALLAATSHGLMRSTDSGRTWAPAPGDLGLATVASVLAHPERNNHLFAAQHDRIFFSTDDGRQWAPLPTQGLERAAIRALAVAKGKPGRLYALAAGRGVFAIDLE
jgi:photosystem II stability/assembly factor-like uncharacterized protein